MESRDALQIGVSRPPLPLADIPTPEEVFGVTRFDPWTVIRCVLGPSMIALGVAIGSGEWLLGPLGFAKFGFMGLGFVVTMSAILQTFYNVENARYTMATAKCRSWGCADAARAVSCGSADSSPDVVGLAWAVGGDGRESSSLSSAGDDSIRAAPAELAASAHHRHRAAALSMTIYLFGRRSQRTLELMETVVLFFILAARRAGDRLSLPRRCGERRWSA